MDNQGTCGTQHSSDIAAPTLSGAATKLVKDQKKMKNKRKKSLSPNTTVTRPNKDLKLVAPSASTSMANSSNRFALLDMDMDMEVTSGSHVDESSRVTNEGPTKASEAAHQNITNDSTDASDTANNSQHNVSNTNNHLNNTPKPPQIVPNTAVVIPIVHDVVKIISPSYAHVPKMNSLPVSTVMGIIWQAIKDASARNGNQPAQRRLHDLQAQLPKENIMQQQHPVDVQSLLEQQQQQFLKGQQQLQIQQQQQFLLWLLEQEREQQQQNKQNSQRLERLEKSVHEMANMIKQWTGDTSTRQLYINASASQ
ncbi:putative uncharacterized protein DDB_G0271606 [Drosophila montana]|uniref:putative uncharacterized protein DDB_G0271606 n=1 Tax=Drosophila montana TaxID=40370 RepID=UPI00313E5BE0